MASTSVLDRSIDRINAWRERERITLREVARAAGIHHNTATNALRHRRCRVATLRRIEALVPDDFHATSVDDHRTNNSELVDSCPKNERAAPKKCDGVAEP